MPSDIDSPRSEDEPSSSKVLQESKVPQETDAATETAPGLRWWPALVLLVAMGALRLIPMMVESPSLPLMMLAFMGPAGLGILLLIWWCFASRATVREKLIGTIAVIAIATVAIMLLHFSLHGMFAVILVIPTGLAAFAFGLIAMARSASRRLPVAICLTLIVFGYWDLKQNEGTTGAFVPQLLWRWEPTAEQRYLSELAQRRSAESPAADSTPVSLESARWPEFRGPDRNGVIRGVTLQTDWQQTPPRQIWKQKIGPGWSSFSVAGNRLYTQEQRGDEEAVICLDANTGALIWDFTYPSRFWEAIAGAGPRATPTITDSGIVALGAEGILLCLDAGDGREVWRRDLKLDAERKPPTWGFSSSPLVVDSLVIVHGGGTGDKGLFAYDLQTGDIVWSIASGDHSYSSAQLATFSDQRGILMLSNRGLQFVNIADGMLIWEHEWPLDNYRVLQPMVVDQSVFFTTSIQEGTRRLDLSHEPEAPWQITEVWTSRNLKSDYNDAVFFDGYIYGFDGGVFTCVDASNGDRKWKRGRYGNGQVVVLKDAGQLLVVSEKGELVLIEASPEELIELAKLQAIEGKTWNHPVVIDSRVYVRNAQEVACYELPTDPK